MVATLWQQFEYYYCYYYYCDPRVRDRVIVRFGLNVSSSAHNCGCVVNDGNAMAAI